MYDYLKKKEERFRDRGPEIAPGREIAAAQPAQFPGHRAAPRTDPKESTGPYGSK